ncbi:MAG: 30S ribosomal protein S4 [Thermoleophilia bacterium]|nr:30S ribosomal protein S4 [Thermoleophilia bacterium]
MARYRGPAVKQSRREGVALTDKAQKYLDRRSYPPGEHGRARIRQSEYLVQLREKQKTRRFYGVLERQFRRYYQKASRQPGITGENLLRLLELRLDNVVYRLGFAATRRQARQFVVHGHFLVNGRRVNIPSYQVRADDVVSVKPSSPVEPLIRDATERQASVAAWLQADHDALNAKILRVPERDDITTPVNEQLIIELYSK